MKPKPYIKFSYAYPKLRSGGDFIKEARLLQIFRVASIRDLSPEFLAYDTDQGKYKFTNTTDPMNVLLFEDPYGVLFTTVRSVQFDAYHREHIGKVFSVVIKERDYK
jgi:hypothetical protein